MDPPAVPNGSFQQWWNVVRHREAWKALSDRTVNCNASICNLEGCWIFVLFVWGEILAVFTELRCTAWFCVYTVKSYINIIYYFVIYSTRLHECSQQKLLLLFILQIKEQKNQVITEKEFSMTLFWDSAASSIAVFTSLQSKEGPTRLRWHNTCKLLLTKLSDFIVRLREAHIVPRKTFDSDNKALWCTYCQTRASGCPLLWVAVFFPRAVVITCNSWKWLPCRAASHWWRLTALLICDMALFNLSTGVSQHGIKKMEITFISALCWLTVTAIRAAVAATRVWIVIVFFPPLRPIFPCHAKEMLQAPTTDHCLRWRMFQNICNACAL